VTFSDQEACRDEALEFITIHHPIMKAVKRYYDDSKQGVYATAQFRLSGGSKYVGKYFFFIYLLEKTALKKDLILIPTLVNMYNGEVHIMDQLSDWFLGEIVNAEAVDKDIVTYDSEQFESASKQAGEFLEMIREEEEEKLRRTNDTLVNNQVESVKQATTIKVRKMKETIVKLLNQGKSEEDPIVRLYKGRIRKFEFARDEKMEGLEQKRAVSVGFNLIGGGLVEIKRR